MGLAIALTIILLWAGHLIYCLMSGEINFLSPLFYFHILVQGYLYTGLFITAHDAMHGTIRPGNKLVNKIVGYIASFLFAGMSYGRLIKNHMDHHKYPGTEKDPDFNIKSQNFFVWWGSFLFRYTTLAQIIIMAAAYNILKIWIPEIKLWFFWIIPAFIGAFQLFFFGTFIPHRKPHNNAMEPHKARTQNKNHFWAMLSCYFFGYHFEHHSSPGTPWWKLYQTKE